MSITPRQQRTKIFRKQVEYEWKEKFRKFIEDNLDKPYWRWLSQNPNTTFDIVLAHPEGLRCPQSAWF